MKKTKKLTVLALSVSLALVLSYIEALLPPIGISGAKVGLANITVVYALYRMGWKEACGISLVRVFIMSMLFGNFVYLAYSAAGALFSLFAMGIVKRTGKFSAVGVSVSGGVCHNIGQIFMAVLLLGAEQIVLYLPVLAVIGTLAGVGIGLAAAMLVNTNLH